MEENKQVVADWKQQNQDRLKEIKIFNPELYSAVNMALSYLNKTLTGEELPVEVEESIVEKPSQELSVEDAAKKYKLSDFYDTRIQIRNEGESRKFQQLIIFALGGSWYSGSKSISSLDAPYLFIGDDGLITLSFDSEWFENGSDKKLIFYDDIFNVQYQQEEELSVLDVTSISTLSDFYDTKIHVRNEKESEKFQQLIIDLGGKWNNVDVSDARLRKIVNFSDKKYLGINGIGLIYFFDNEHIYEKYIAEEIFYDDIFKDKKSAKSQTSEWRLKTKQELESEFGKDFRRYSVPEGYFNDWYGQNLAEIYGPKYQNIKQAEDSLRSNNIELGLSGFSLPTKYFTKEVLTSSQTNEYKFPIDTYPVTLKNKYSFFEANDGSRKSPTQSAGDLKREVLDLPGNELSEILNTKFRGNDNKWYELNVGKGGVWTWKKLNDVENYETQFKFLEETTKPTPTPYIPTSTPTPVQTQQSQFSYSDLVGRQLNWNGTVYDIVKLKKTNPKTIVYDFKNSSGGVESVAVPKHTIEALLLGTRLVKGITLLPKAEETKKYDYSTMSDIKLSKLRRDTAEARDAFEFDDPEYTELSTQVGLMIDEMMRRNIL
jgi:hypothetical protein